MLLHLPHILNDQELASARQLLGADAPWVDGSSSAGPQALSQKNNQQLRQDSETSHQLQAITLQALQREPMFLSAALPRRIFNPLFNRYGGHANHYGNHIDGAVLRSANTGEWVRSDLSCTLFLSEPGDYEGGELVIEDAMNNAAAAQRLKFAAGDLVLYPSTHVHRVEPVTQGVRLASFFWVESMVRSGEQRRILFDLDMNLLRLRQQLGETDETTALTGVYHNLLRQWAST